MPHLPDSLVMGVVSLRVADLARQTAFYRDSLGLQVRQQTPKQVMLGSAAHDLVQLLAFPNGRHISYSTGLYHLALRLPNRSALADWLAHYIAIEHPGWQGASDHGVSEALYLADPEGNGIEVYCDKPRTVWQLGPVGRVNMPTRRLDLQALLDVRSGQPWQGLASSTDMGHVHLQVSDLAATQQFYVQQLGFAETMTLPDSALFVSVGGYHHHLGFNTWHSRAAPPLPADGLGLASYEICLPDSQSLANVLTRVSTNSLIAPPTADSVFVRDPAGITVHLTVPKVGAAAVLSLK